MQTFQIQIHDTVLSSNINDSAITQKINYYKGSDEKFRYNVLIFLSGPDIIYVQKVRYILHKTFKQPIRVVDRTFSNPNCSLRIWMWGAFELKAEIFLKNGEVIPVTHQLNFTKEIEQAKSEPKIRFNNTGSAQFE